MRSFRIISNRVSVVAFLAALTIAGAGCGSSSVVRPTTTMATNNSAASKVVGVGAFAAKISDRRVVTINVHVPNEGNIAGTDLVIPYTEIRDSPKLPANRATPLAVYCRSGNMSAKAVIDLRAMGFTDITELKDGYNAWKAAGRTLQSS